MPEFHPGETLDRTDLALYLVDADEQPTNAYEISYAIYYVDPVPVETEVLIGSATRTPVNPTVGEYWAALMIPPSAEAGTYRIRWTFKQYAGNAASTVTQEFTVVATEDLTVTTYNAGETAMIRSLRMQLRDQCISGEECVEVDTGDGLVVTTLASLWDAVHGSGGDTILWQAFSGGNLKVRSLSPYGQVEWQNVSGVHRKTTDEFMLHVQLNGGLSFKVTERHRVYISDAEAIHAGFLGRGDAVRTFAGILKVEAVDGFPPPQYVYDLTVEGNHNLVLHNSGVVVHNCPDRFYHFRPPEQEGRIGRYDKVFGQIWEDEELYEYLLRALDWYNSAPPATGIPTLARLVADKPEWREAIVWNAVSKACFAVGLNWVADQFSLAPDTLVRVRVDGVEQDITLEGLYAQGANPEGVEVRSVCPNTGAVRWSAVSAVLRHATGHKKAYRVTVGLGASVVATEDHSLFRYGSGGIPVPVHTGDLTEGQALFCVGADGEPTGSLIDRVREVDPLEVSYDLSVPGDENFVLSNGILAHNSYSIGGVSLDINKASEYQNMASYAMEQSDKAREIKQLTVKYIRGLQQPRFGVGLRAGAGPHVGRGVLSPRSFV